MTPAANLTVASSTNALVVVAPAAVIPEINYASCAPVVAVLIAVNSASVAVPAA
jgi:hypothetical protein